MGNTHNLRDENWVASHNIDGRTAIFLDTCFWDHFFEGKQQSYTKAMNLIKALVKQGKLHVVANGMLLSEVAARDDSKQVGKILNLIHELSLGCYLRDFSTVLKLELEIHKEAVKLGVAPRKLKKDEVFGCFWESLRELTYTKEGSAGLSGQAPGDLLQKLSKKFYENKPTDYSATALKEFGEGIKNAMGKMCSAYTDEKTTSGEHAVKLAKQRTFASELVENTKEVINVTTTIPGRKGETRKGAEETIKKVMKVYLDRPTKISFLSMLEYLKRHKKANMCSNDIIDIVLVGATLPYCDIIFCDKNTKELCKMAKLDSQFNTRIYTHIELDQLIENLGNL